MNVTCPNCATVYRVDPAKVPQSGVRARCAVCSAVFAVSREMQDAEAPRRSSPVAAPEPPPPPVSPVAEPRDAPPLSAPPLSAPPATRPPPASRPLAAPAAPRPMRSAAPVGSAPMPPRPAAPAQGLNPPAFNPPPVPASPPPPVSRPVAGPPSPGGRPANPFLSQDPSLKAKRLARALVSDIVVYHPAKRQEGIRDGTLKELFEEEIKKSWEEYTEQVGREVAESTGFFREALNEILAGGRQLF